MHGRTPPHIPCIERHCHCTVTLVVLLSNTTTGTVALAVKGVLCIRMVLLELWSCDERENKSLSKRWSIQPPCRLPIHHGSHREAKQSNRPLQRTVVERHAASNQAELNVNTVLPHCTFQLKVQATVKGGRQLHCGRLRHFSVYLLKCSEACEPFEVSSLCSGGFYFFPRGRN